MPATPSYRKMCYIYCNDTFPQKLDFKSRFPAPMGRDRAPFNYLCKYPQSEATWPTDLMTPSGLSSDLRMATKEDPEEFETFDSMGNTLRSFAEIRPVLNSESHGVTSAYEPAEIQRAAKILLVYLYYSNVCGDHFSKSVFLYHFRFSKSDNRSRATW